MLAGSFSLPLSVYLCLCDCVCLCVSTRSNGSNPTTLNQELLVNSCQCDGMNQWLYYSTQLDTIGYDARSPWMSWISLRRRRRSRGS